jgi:chorismate synthase
LLREIMGRRARRLNERTTVIRYATAGESHGPSLTAILEGIPAGVVLTEAYVNQELARRQYSFGRGERLQYIEKDQAQVSVRCSLGGNLGVAHHVPDRKQRLGKLGKDHVGVGGRQQEKFRLTRPRPGHADLVGVLKFDRKDTRDILERASARETAARTAVGAVCRRLLEEVGSKSIPGWRKLGRGPHTDGFGVEEAFALAEKSPFGARTKRPKKK